MGGNLQRLTPGQPLTQISAGTWGRFADATLALEKLQIRPGVADFAATPQSSYVQLSNATGADRSPRHIVGYDEHALDWPTSSTALPEREIPVGKAIAPVDGERFAVLRDFMESGEANTSFGQVAGLAYVLVDIKDAADTFCGPVDDQYTHLDSGIGSTPILAKSLEGESPATGVQWCVVLLGGTGNVSIDSKFAIVATSLDPGTLTGSGSTTAFEPGTKGTAWLMAWAWTGSEWRLSIPAESAPFECVSGYTDITIPPDAFVRIDFSGDLAAGYTIDAGHEPPIATIVEDNEYRRQLPGYDGGEVQVFYHDASGVQRWNKVTC